MAPAVVYLHIGLPKTGSTYLQGVLWANEEALAADGVLLGSTRPATKFAVGDLLKWQRRHGDLPASWRRLSEQAAAWDGHSLVLSQEQLHNLTDAQFEALAASFPGARIEVVLTARDVGRTVPAQWQSSVRQRYSWTLGEYADAVAATPPAAASGGAARHFWRRQDSPTILQRFVDRLPVEHVRVVTVPPSGGDPDELWGRFARACGLGTYSTPGEATHESLGAASAELMRRLNAMPAVAELSLSEYKQGVNHALSRHSLAPRRSEEPGLVLPDRHRAWAERESERIIAGLVATGVEVVGDLDDLRPSFGSKPYVDPEHLHADELLEAALAGLAGMAQRHVEVRGEQAEWRAEAAAATAATAATAAAAAARRAAARRAAAHPAAPPVARPAAEPQPPVRGGSGPVGPSGLSRVLRRLRRGA